MANLSLPSPNGLKTMNWTPPEILAATTLGLGVVGTTIYFWGEYVAPFLAQMLSDTLHMVFLGSILAAIAYLIFGSKPRLIFRVLLRSLLSIFVSVFPVQIVEDKLIQMKKRRDKMNEQIALVRGAIEKLKRIIDQNHKDAVTGFSMAAEAKKLAGQKADPNDALRMERQVQLQARKAQRREQSNIGFAALLDRLTKVYNFLTRYSTNVDFLIEDTEDEITQKKTEYQTTSTAFGAMKTAMSVIAGNASDEDFYNQAFETMENTVSTQLGVMDDLQRISQNFMDGMDVQTGAVDDAALKALDAFEQRVLTAGATDPDLQMLSSTSRTNPAKSYALAASATPKSSTDDFDPFK